MLRLAGLLAVCVTPALLFRAPRSSRSANQERQQQQKPRQPTLRASYARRARRQDSPVRYQLQGTSSAASVGTVRFLGVDIEDALELAEVPNSEPTHEATAADAFQLADSAPSFICWRESYAQSDGKYSAQPHIIL
jgi:hypothetical protein